MDWISRLDVLHNKVVDLVSKLDTANAENELLKSENSTLYNMVEALELELKSVKEGTEQANAQKEEIKSRVERLIEMID